MTISGIPNNLRISTLVASIHVIVGNGTAALPSIRFSGTAGLTGLYWAGPGVMGFSSAGVASLSFNAGGIISGTSSNHLDLPSTGAVALTAGGTNQNITLTPSGTGLVIHPASTLAIADTNASHYLILNAGSDLTANRTLTLTTGDAARTITLTGNATLNQDVSTTASPTFAGGTFNGKLSVTGASSSATVSEFATFDTLTTDLAIWRRSDSAVSCRLRYDGGTGDMLFGTTTAHNVQIQRGGTTVGTFTSTGLNNTVIGATTPAAISGTTLAASGTVTFSGVNQQVNGGTTASFVTYGNSTTASYFAVFGATHATRANELEAAGSKLTVNIAGTGNVGVFSSTGLAVTGTTTSTTDIESTTVGSGFIVKSPNGTRWRITVDNAGAFVATSL